MKHDDGMKFMPTYGIIVEGALTSFPKIAKLSLK